MRLFYYFFRNRRKSSNRFFFHLFKLCWRVCFILIPRRFKSTIQPADTGINSLPLDLAPQAMIGDATNSWMEDYSGSMRTILAGYKLATLYCSKFQSILSDVEEIVQLQTGYLSIKNVLFVRLLKWDNIYSFKRYFELLNILPPACM